MNYNANTGGRAPRKIKRVSDVNSMGYNPQQVPPNIYPTLPPEPITPINTNIPPNAYQQQEYTSQPFQQGYGGPPNQIPIQNYPYASTTPYGNNVPIAGPVPVPQMGVFGQPVVQDMALQYGQQLANTGTTMLKKEVERFVPVTKLKYYFAVDTTYVMKKLALILFPFFHKDWSVKYEQDNPIQPRFEINAPDLYIPTMAYVTYVVVAALVLGTQQRFSPEQIGLLASTALAWCLVEIALYSCTLYIMHIETKLRTLDLVAFSGYKFVGIIISILMSLIGRKPYYVALVLTNLSLGIYFVRALKLQVLSETTSYYGDVAAPTTTGHRRRSYFLLFMAAVQPFLSWWLTSHLNGTDISPASKLVDL